MLFSGKQTLGFSLLQGIVIRVPWRLMMKILTFEVSNCSLVLTNIVESSGGWECSSILSQQTPGSSEVVHKSTKSFSGLYDPEHALEIGSEFANAFIEDCFPELADVADSALAS